MDIRRFRRFVEARQVDVSRATGISLQRLSDAERGLASLDAGEIAAIEDFLKARARAISDSTERIRNSFLEQVKEGECVN
jgi:transcriptional regulator with XRE-family HTH domain